MNKCLDEALAFTQALKLDEPNVDSRIQRFVIPPFTLVHAVKASLSATSVKVGAQNMHWADSGAWTGEISPLMLKDAKLDIVELGHSERREHFGETNASIGMKTEAAIRHGLVPLVCIGETLAEREAGRADAILTEQVETALGRLSAEQRHAPLLFAYEPVWAIGDNGIPASADYADRQHALILSVAEHVLGRSVQCLYGGSVNPGNCVGLIQCEHIHGLFIGRSAWQAESYIDILHRCTAALS